MIRSIFFLLLASTLSGCSWIFGEDGLFPDNAGRYQTAPELSPIDVPPRLSTESIQPDYPVPPVTESTQLAKYNILVQASASMLAQANQSSSVALMLLG